MSRIFFFVSFHPELFAVDFFSHRSQYILDRIWCLPGVAYAAHASRRKIFAFYSSSNGKFAMPIYIHSISVLDGVFFSVARILMKLLNQFEHILFYFVQVRRLPFFGDKYLGVNNNNNKKRIKYQIDFISVYTLSILFIFDCGNLNFFFIVHRNTLMRCGHSRFDLGPIYPVGIVDFGAKIVATKTS